MVLLTMSEIKYYIDRVSYGGSIFREELDNTLYYLTDRGVWLRTGWTTTSIPITFKLFELNEIDLILHGITE